MSNTSENKKNANVLNENELNKVNGGATKGMIPDYFPTRRKKQNVAGNSADAECNSTPIGPMPFK